MTLRPTFSRMACAVALAWLALVVPQSVRAQGFDFLWGGDDEHGGSRQLIAFSTQYSPGQIIVSFTDRRLYHVVAPGRAMSYPVAVPTGEARWQGVTFVSEKKINPSWTPTPEMIAKNPRLPSWVPGGHPMNPLGDRAMYLGSSSYRIHGTDAPWTIGQAVSHGCIRMLNEDVHELYPKVDIGTRVTVTWQKFASSAVASTSASKSWLDQEGQPVRRYKRPGSSSGASAAGGNGQPLRKYYRPNYQRNAQAEGSAPAR